MSEGGFSIITPTIREREYQTIIANYLRQKNIKKELIILINNDAIEIEPYKMRYAGIKDISFYQIPQEKSLGACLNIGIKYAKYDYIVRFDDDDYYGPHYLDEAIRVIHEKKCDILGKSSTFCFYKEIGLLIQRGDGRQNQYGTISGGATMIFKKSVWQDNPFREINKGEDTHMMKECINKGYVVYSGSEYNFMVNRTVSGENHTNKRSLEVFQKAVGYKKIAEHITYEEAIRWVNSRK